MEQHMEATADETMLPQTSNHSEGVQEAPRKPKLSMKMLQEQIHELEIENHLLFQRLEQLEQLLAQKATGSNEAAASLESPAPDKPAEKCAVSPLTRTSTSNNDYALALVLSQPVLIPRSERHPVPKRTFWRSFFMFRSRF